MPRAQAVHPDPTQAVSIPLPLSAPLHSQVPGQLQQRRLTRIVHGADQPFIRDAAGHAGDDDHGAVAAAGVPLEHGAGGAGTRHEDAAVVDVHHVAHLLDGVVDGRLELLHARRRDDAVQPLVLIRDGAHHPVQRRRVAHVDTRVRQAAAEGARDARAGVVEVGDGLLEAVEAVDCWAGDTDAG